VSHGPPRSDALLVQACLDGDADAWDVLLDRYGRLIYSIAMKAGLSPDDAADVLQLVSMSLLDHLADLRDADRLLPWIATTTRRHALHTLRRNRRLTTGMGCMGADEGGTAGDVAPVPGDLSAGLIALHDQQLVREALSRLTPHCREVLELLFCNDPPASYAEIASRLNVPIGSIGPTRARCLRRLHKVLSDLGF